MFLLGVAVWLFAGCGFIGVYSDTLFWVRALQVVLLLMVVPFGLALAMPITVAGAMLGEARIDRVLRSPVARMIASPWATSAAMIVTPWLIYLTAWYPALLRSAAIDTTTRLVLVLCGAGYFYTRLQLDPVPRRYPQSLSLLITLAETLGDGVLGVILWQGPLVAASFYQALDRTWGPALRTDQTIGAGILWVLGDVIGLPFLMVLFSAFRSEETARAVKADAELDAQDIATATPAGRSDNAPDPPALWWENHPELRDRLR